MSNAKFLIHNETDLSAEQHVEIHAALNKAYGHRTKLFLKKSYGHCEPIKRVLYIEDGKIIGHTAIFEDYAYIGSDKIKIAGIGLTLSLVPHRGIGYQIRKKALDACQELPCLFAVGRIQNLDKIKDNLRDLMVEFIDIPLIGKTTRSHDWETLEIYNLKHDPKQVNAYLDCFKKEGELRIQGEVF